jgi:gluconolactonase
MGPSAVFIDDVRAESTAREHGEGHVSRIAWVVSVLAAVSPVLIGQAPNQQQGGLPTVAIDPPAEVVASDIPGVITGGTKVRLVRAGFNGAESPISMSDGSLLFVEYEANKVIKIDNAGNVSTFVENTNRTIGLAFDGKGRLIGTQSREPRVGVLYPYRATLAAAFEGQPLVRPNDLVIDRKGGIYFSDPIPGATRFREPPEGRKPLIFYITPQGTITKSTEYVTSPNGVQLSPDEQTLYATNGDRIVAFDVQPDGRLTNPRTFVESGGDGMAVDSAGRLYSAVASLQAIRVFSPRGEDLGTIPVGVGPQAVAFAGPEKKTLYAVGRGAVYKADMIAEGIRTRAK